MHVTNCVSACASMFSSVWRKMWEEWEMWTWVQEKLPMLLSLFRICAWKHISEFLPHWLSWPTAKLEEIHNINGHCENENTYFLFFPMLVSTHHIPDDGQDEKLKELIWFVPLILFICFMLLPKMRENFDSPSPYGFSFISSNRLTHCKSASSSGLSK